MWIKPSYDAKVPQATEQNRVQRCPMSINIHTLKTRQRSGCWLPPDPLCGCCVFCGIVLCLLWHISCRISEPKKHTNFSLHQKQANFFLQRAYKANFFLQRAYKAKFFLQRPYKANFFLQHAYKANFFLQRACGANFFCNAYVAKQLTGIAKLYGMMKLFNISVTKQHRNNGI